MLLYQVAGGSKLLESAYDRLSCENQRVDIKCFGLCLKSAVPWCIGNQAVRP